MAISSALQSAVAGLSANATAVEKVSENIANSATVGYKRQFASMVTTTTGGGSGSGVKAELRQSVALAGQTTATASATDLAISGDGLFVVSKNPNDPVQSNYVFTRAGSFTPDENGFLRNAAGYYLAGFPMNAEGNLGTVDYTTFGSVETLKVDGVQMNAVASTTASMKGNLPASETGTGEPTAAFVSTMQYYNALGSAESLSISWQASETVENVWQATVTGSDGTLYGTVDVTFSDSGATPGAPASFAGTADAGLGAPSAFTMGADGIMTITINNGTVPQTISVSLGTVGGYEGVTQFDGDYTPQTFSVDGSAVASLESTEIDEQGILWGVFGNGKRTALYQIPLATVTNPDGMELVNGNAYRTTIDSGNYALSLAGTAGTGTITSNALESSTVDVAQEMTDLIQIQRNYSSNAKVVTTADEMLQEVTNLKR